MTQTAETFQKIFTDAFLTALAAKLPQNLPLYEKSGVWISEVAETRTSLSSRGLNLMTISS